MSHLLADVKIGLFRCFAARRIRHFLRVKRHHVTVMKKKKVQCQSHANMQYFHYLSFHHFHSVIHNSGCKTALVCLCRCRFLLRQQFVLRDIEFARKSYFPASCFTLFSISPSPKWIYSPPPPPTPTPSRLCRSSLPRLRIPSKLLDAVLCHGDRARNLLAPEPPPFDTQRRG